MGHCWRAVNITADATGCITGDMHFTEKPNATKATSDVSQKTYIHQNGDSRPSTDKQSLDAFHTADQRRKSDPT